MDTFKAWLEKANTYRCGNGCPPFLRQKRTKCPFCKSDTKRC